MNVLVYQLEMTSNAVYFPLAFPYPGVLCPVLELAFNNLIAGVAMVAVASGGFIEGIGIEVNVNALALSVDQPLHH